MAEAASHRSDDRAVNTGTASRDVLPEHAPTDVNWESIERDGDFRELIRQKRNFIIPATLFFLIFYFGFLIVVGYIPDFVNIEVMGHINIAYLLAISQFIMAWLLMYLYVRRANSFDRQAEHIVDKVQGGKE